MVTNSTHFLAGHEAWVTDGMTGMGQAIAGTRARAGANIAIGGLPAAANFATADYAARAGQVQVPPSPSIEYATVVVLQFRLQAGGHSGAS